MWKYARYWADISLEIRVKRVTDPYPVVAVQMHGVGMRGLLQDVLNRIPIVGWGAEHMSAERLQP